MQSRARVFTRPRIERLWERELPLREIPGWIPLAAAAGVYRAAVGARNLYWRMMSRESGVPIISVGNLTVGGNGKTPFTLFIAKRLQSRGLRIAIVSRGYNRKPGDADAQIVADHGELKTDPESAGDEPAMMAKSFSGPIAVARRRIHAIELLRSLGPIDAVILDDGFQHVRLKRDVDLVLVSGDRGLGNGWMIPAGPMREPIGAVRRADAVVMMSFGHGKPALSASQMKVLGAGKVFHAAVHARALVVSEQTAWREMPLPLAGRRVLAVSGLANPAGFYAMLREADADLVGVLEYPDHHAYTAADWQAVVSAARSADLIVTTEKDLVKLERFPFARDSLYALRLEVKMDPADADALDKLILGHVNRGAEIANEQNAIGGTP
jgi:tetraacyldisaccharide 4'-kinase